MEIRIFKVQLNGTDGIITRNIATCRAEFKKPIAEVFLSYPSNQELTQNWNERLSTQEKLICIVKDEQGKILVSRRAG